jgi:hypothetical protein
MKTIQTLALTFALMLTGYAYATADTQAANDQAAAKAACCADQTACKQDGAACCAQSAACCKEGAACCAEGAACCADHAACCKAGAACCSTGAACCAAKQAADKVTVKAVSKSEGRSEKGGCCAAGSCKMAATGK